MRERREVIVRVIPGRARRARLTLFPPVFFFFYFFFFIIFWGLFFDLDNPLPPDLLLLVWASPTRWIAAVVVAVASASRLDGVKRAVCGQ